MTRLHFIAGVRVGDTLADFESVRATLNGELPRLAAIPLDATIALLTRLGRELALDAELGASEGAAYLALWLRRSNLERLCRLDYLADHRFEHFAPSGADSEMRACPRGIVCHWVAANMPTLAVFSLALAMLSRNASALKVPEPALPLLLGLLERLGGLEAEVGGTTYSGRDLVRGIAVVTFSGADRAANEAFSAMADVKMVWGDAEAVRAVTALPQQEHCEILSFGPKYAFGVFDRACIASERFEAALEAAARDVAVFSQRACSSPHVLFFEESPLGLEAIATRLAAAFGALPARALHPPPDPLTASRIIEARMFHLLEDGRDARVSPDLSWTILIHHAEGLEEPVCGRTVWVKQVASVLDAAAFVTRRVQAIGIAIDDEPKRRRFAEAATARGADRIVAFGRMHEFDLPWDGMLVLNRLVRWVILKP